MPHYEQIAERDAAGGADEVEREAREKLPPVEKTMHVLIELVVVPPEEVGGER